MNRASPVIAFAVAVLGIAIFSAMDAVMKALVLAIGTYNALVWRMGAGAAISGALYAWKRPAWPSRAVLAVHVQRALVSAVMAVLFFWGLARVPIAQAVALTFIAPLIALFLAAFVLQEKIRRETILGSLLAFGGVLTIFAGQARVDMGPEAFWGAVAILCSACCYAWNIILMRRQSLVAGPVEISFFQSGLVLAVYLVAAPWLIVVPPAGQVLPIVAAAAMAVASMMLLAWAYARAEASVLSASEYTAFIWGALFGWMVFGEVVSLFTVAGAVLIVAGCVVGLRRRPEVPVADTEAQL